MKITTITTTRDEYGYKEECHFTTEIKTNEGSARAGFGNGEPEDMSLSRNLSDAYDIPKMLKLAYNAGKNGEEYELVEEKEEW